MKLRCMSHGGRYPIMEFSKEDSTFNIKVFECVECHKRVAYNTLEDC